MSTTHYTQLRAQIEQTMSNPSTTIYTKSFIILFCILFEVIINVDGNEVIAFHKNTCDTLVSNYFHRLHELLQTGSVNNDGLTTDFKELCEIVGFIQEDVSEPSAYNKKMIAVLMSKYCD
jgi:hypothetical protein